MIRFQLTRPWLVTTVLSAMAAGLLSGIPSTVWAFATDGDPWEATRAAALVLVSRDDWFPLQIAAATVVHGGMSLFWAGVLCGALSPKRAVLDGLGAGFSIAVLDLLVIGQTIPVMRDLPFLPQLADHLAFGGVVGAVVTWRGRQESANAAVIALEFSARRIRWSFLVAPALCALVSLVKDDGAFFIGVIATGLGLLRLVSFQFEGMALDDWWVVFSLIVGLMACVISIRHPGRIGWLFCAHACLSAYWVLSWSVGQAVFHSMSL